jgi:hypothetical protein
MIGDAFAPTGDVETVKFAVVAPAKTVTLAGTVAAAVMLLVRLTVIPAAGAAELMVTVPVELVPPVTAVGFSKSWLTACGFTVKTACWLLPL